MGGAAGGMAQDEYRIILNNIIQRRGIEYLIRENRNIWDIILTCNAPIEVYQSLESISIPEINARFIKSCAQAACGIFKLEEMIMGKKWWIKSKSASERLLLRKIIGDFIIDKGLDGILMPEIYAVMVEKNPESSRNEILSFKRDLTSEEYVAYRKVKQDDQMLKDISELYPEYPSTVVELINKIKTEGTQESDEQGGDGNSRYKLGSELYEIVNGNVFLFTKGFYDIYLLLEHINTSVKMCDTYVGLHIMYLVNEFPLDLGGKRDGVNFAVTEEGICSIIDCEIKGDNTLATFFSNFQMIDGVTNFEEQVAQMSSGNGYLSSYSEESLRGGVPCLNKDGEPECSPFPYLYDNNKKGLFNLYYLLLIKELTIENVSEYRQREGKNFTNEDVAELKTILSGDHFSKCEIPDQFEILDTLLLLNAEASAAAEAEKAAEEAIVAAGRLNTSQLKTIKTQKDPETGQAPSQQVIDRRIELLNNEVSFNKIKNAMILSLAKGDQERAKKISENLPDKLVVSKVCRMKLPTEDQNIEDYYA